MFDLPPKAMKIVDELTDTVNDQSRTITALRARAKELEAHLNQYLVQFDDDSLTDEQVKHWLDAYWIPTTRAALRGEA